ncbi:hypothetical protein H4J02_03425 [Protaetiibacter sp. SSC-01]|uniref:hypothetical protein n=1 Tax=Protaetiibacter sp. SSC-01 TaxID=2759943 RepID=UPI001656A406|nr:hypothetical protein [Protaetiibacter sp. SSC-01]QNO38093.1 hypothetical protein H4J02_03425 [Protaetiibacter sp. SSC-01]
MVLYVAAIVSVPFVGQYGPLPSTVMLDAWFGLFLISALLTNRWNAPLLLGVVVAFGFTRVVGFFATSSPAEDFFQAYRWVFYLAAFAIGVRRVWTPVGGLVALTWTLLSLATVKAALGVVLVSGSLRPGLFLENNFELALFCGLVAVMYRFLGRGRFPMIALLGVLVLLSGSRSGAVTYVVLLVYAFTQIPRTHSTLFLRFVTLIAAPIGVLIPVWIFSERADGSRIDRLNFLDVFLYETSDWNLLNWLLGTPPITPLSNEGCLALAWYQDLFASTGDGSCYVVILHAFVLRVIFDAGLLGLGLAFGVAWVALRRSDVSRMLSLTLIGIAAANSLSVSGLNNPYVALPILLAMLTAKVAVHGAEMSRGSGAVEGAEFGPEVKRA